MNEKLIVALDVATRAEAVTLVEKLAGVVSFFKVGSQLFTSEGPGLVRDILSQNVRIFLDLKFHDIPNTVAESVIAATRLGVTMLNVHASGGSVMMAEANRRLTAAVEAEQLALPMVIAVTVLTSSDQSTMDELGIAQTPAGQVVRLAKLTQESGLHGVVASPKEITLIREAIPDPTFHIVTPGVRPVWAAANDQKRVMTPGEAIRAGASYLVVGRPITAHPDPAEAATRVIEEMISVCSQ
ncbi:MAG: orotidine-5'-phosphate decarboxylase [Acidobacteria bacterium]|nr:orotidine-5'-phosphate decarboxylase [Acidobacteriota bacterium]